MIQWPMTSTRSPRTIYKAASEDAHLGDVQPVTEEEWVKLAALLEPDPTAVEAGAVAPLLSQRQHRVIDGCFQPSFQIAEPTPAELSLCGNALRR